MNLGRNTHRNNLGVFSLYHLTCDDIRGEMGLSIPNKHPVFKHPIAPYRVSSNNMQALSEC